jgi:hypothetical protein
MEVVVAYFRNGPSIRLEGPRKAKTLAIWNSWFPTKVWNRVSLNSNNTCWILYLVTQGYFNDILQRNFSDLSVQQIPFISDIYVSVPDWSYGDKYNNLTVFSASENGRNTKLC